MNTLQKIIVVAVLAVAVGAGIYQTKQASSLRTEVETLQQKVRVKAQSPEERASVASLQEKVEVLKAENAGLTRALGEAHADNARLVKEREQANHSVALYKELADKAGSQDSSVTNLYPTPRHVWTAFGKFGRLMALSKDEDAKLSAEDKAALDEAKMKALGELPALIKAAKQLDAFKSAGAAAPADDTSDNLACLFYGALELDEQQFGQVYALMQNYEEQANQKGLFQTNALPEEKTAALGQMIDKFKGDMQGLLRPDQSRIFAELVKNIKLEPGNFSFNFNF